VNPRFEYRNHPRQFPLAPFRHPTQHETETVASAAKWFVAGPTGVIKAHSGRRDGRDVPDVVMNA
jgi:hypothetical protein